MSKKILTVGFEIASSDTTYASFRSKLSLLDWDIIVFRPFIGEFYSYTHNYYQGKPSLNDSDSFRLKECCEHWRREIKQAFKNGKTVFVYLPTLQEVYVDTGERSYSGTGRNRKTTRHVSLYNNYEVIPVNLGPVATTGSSMRLAARGADILATYWAEFEEYSHYEVLLTDENIPACIVTRTGDKAVGALYRSTASTGTLLLLPDIEFEDEQFMEETEAREDTEDTEYEQTWAPAAFQFAKKFVTSIVGLDNALRTTSDITPEPLWASTPQYALMPEGALRSQLLEAEAKVEQAQKEKEAIAERLAAAGKFRTLLYEKGKPLEGAIIEALRLLGFKAESFKKADSEFDVVFECDEGRLIGEVEGKDNKSINVDKLRQLAMNIHEDLEREEVDSPAKAVLFGNGFRLQPLEERADPFSKKCQSAAATSSTALVSTPDLFTVIQYIVGQPDLEFARLCRQALLQTTGRVTFPAIPGLEVPQIETDIEQAGPSDSSCSEASGDRPTANRIP